MKIHIFSLLLFTTSVCFGQSNFSQVKESTSLIAEIKKHNLSVNSIESVFKQEKYISAMSSKFMSEGKFLFKKERKIRWIYLKPINFTIVIKDNLVQMKDEVKVSSYDMNSDKSFKQANDLLLKVVQGTIFGDKDYSYQFMENSELYKIILTPTVKKGSNVFSIIEMLLIKKSFDVAGITLKESKGDYIKLTF